MTTRLAIDTVHLSYGCLPAVDGVSLTVPVGGRHAIIGPNGAGKTTLLNIVAGLIHPDHGAVRLDGQDITRHGPAWRSRAGVGRIHQRPAVWGSLTAMENVVVAGWRQHGGFRAIPTRSRYRTNLTEPAARSLAQIDLMDSAGVPAGSLSHGQRRRLEIAMALAGNPRLLLLDEPAAGLSPAEVDRLADVLRGLPPDVSVLLIEHHLELVNALADTVTMMKDGRVVVTGTPAEVQASVAATEAYVTAVA
jgi:branched-chain amino acid transport system ATP-binding protein